MTASARWIAFRSCFVTTASVGSPPDFSISPAAHGLFRNLTDRSVRFRNLGDRSPRFQVRPLSGADPLGALPDLALHTLDHDTDLRPDLAVTNLLAA